MDNPQTQATMVTRHKTKAKSKMKNTEHRKLKMMSNMDHTNNSKILSRQNNSKILSR